MANLHLEYQSTLKFILRTIGLDRKRFEQFYLASILMSESDKGQISTLLYCITRNAEDALDSTKLPKRIGRIQYSTIEKFNSYFQVWRKQTKI